MTIEGWGKDEWGKEYWGGAEPLPPIALESALAVSTKEVLVTFNRDPQAIGPTVPGDALNPATWVIQRLDTAFLFSVLAVRQTGPLGFVVLVLQDFGSSKVPHRITTTTLLDADGNPITIPVLNEADFPGVLAAEAKDEPTKASNKARTVRDVANKPTPSAYEGGSQVGGTLIINSAGDYELESGAALVRKLIIRRLVTRKGDFFHLPDYGVGLAVKDPLPVVNLVKMRAEIVRQVLKEPEVKEAEVSLSLGTQGDLSIVVRAKLRSGNSEIEIGLKATPNGVVF